MDYSIDLDKLIEKLLQAKDTSQTKDVNITEHEICQLCSMSMEILLSQHMLLDLKAPIQICGDIHGQYNHLLKLFDYCCFPPIKNYLFLGDYVEGKQSLETICLLLTYKVKYPEKIFLLRGTHECKQINRIYGLYDECKHFNNDIQGWDVNQRGGACVFGSDVICNFLKENNLQLLCKANHVVEEGYQILAKGQLITIFSASNYCGEFKNSGAIICVDKDLMCSFKIFWPQEKQENFIAMLKTNKIQD